MAFGILPIAVAFFAATVVILMMKTLSLREAYDAVEWPILIMLGALIAVSDAFAQLAAQTL